MQVVIGRAGNEIHVSVPFALKERAKKVKGYRWIPALKVWTYPYSQSTFSELIAEFGDDAMVEGFEAQPRARLSEPTIAEELQSKIKEQGAQLAAASERIEKLLREQGLLSRQAQDLNQQLGQKNAELESATKLIDSLKTAPEQQKLKQSIEFWKRAAEENEKNIRTPLDSCEKGLHRNHRQAPIHSRTRSFT
jgi:signal recognition particle GTPase